MSNANSNRQEIIYIYFYFDPQIKQHTLLVHIINEWEKNKHLPDLYINEK